MAAEQRTTRRFGKSAAGMRKARGATWKFDGIGSVAFEFGDALECEPVRAPVGIQLPVQAASNLCEELFFARGKRLLLERAI